MLITITIAVRRYLRAELCQATHVETHVFLLLKDFEKELFTKTKTCVILFVSLIVIKTLVRRYLRAGVFVTQPRNKIKICFEFLNCHNSY